MITPFQILSDSEFIYQPYHPMLCGSVIIVTDLSLLPQSKVWEISDPTTWF
jgi:hypothetical protein